MRIRDREILRQRDIRRDIGRIEGSEDKTERELVLASLRGEQIVEPGKTLRIYTMMSQNWLDNYNSFEPMYEKIVGYRIPKRLLKRMSNEGWELDKVVVGVNASRWASGLEHKKRRDILEFTLFLLEQGELPKIWIQEHKEMYNNYDEYVGTEYVVRSIDLPRDKAERIRQKMINDIRNILSS